ncbi:hypothetical protein ACXR2U_14415 [Jatrophihabitans sp. YIM 134969]
MTVLFGGEACPLGASVQFVEAPEDDVVALLPAGDRGLTSTPTGVGFAPALPALTPFQAPWTRMLTASAGRWTAVANNFLHGGDGTAPGPGLARQLGVRCVVATHLPPYGPGHAQTQLEISGPGGPPPLLGIRSLSATATDGRWQWFGSGDPLPFERTDTYARRRIRERFDRDLLLEYLAALGVPVEDTAFGDATLHQQLVSWPTRAVTLDEARRDFERPRDTGSGRVS